MIFIRMRKVMPLPSAVNRQSQRYQGLNHRRARSRDTQHRACLPSSAFTDKSRHQRAQARVHIHQAVSKPCCTLTRVYTAVALTVKAGVLPSHMYGTVRSFLARTSSEALSRLSSILLCCEGHSHAAVHTVINACDITLFALPCFTVSVRRIVVVLAGGLALRLHPHSGRLVRLALLRER